MKLKIFFLPISKSLGPWGVRDGWLYLKMWKKVKITAPYYVTYSGPIRWPYSFPDNYFQSSKYPATIIFGIPTCTYTSDPVKNTSWLDSCKKKNKLLLRSEWKIGLSQQFFSRHAKTGDQWRPAWGAVIIWIKQHPFPPTPHYVKDQRCAECLS